MLFVLLFLYAPLPHTSLIITQEGQSKTFTLYVSPPRRVFPDTAILQEEGMVPAAVVHLSWDDVRIYLPTHLPVYDSV